MRYFYYVVFCLALITGCSSEKSTRSTGQSNSIRSIENLASTDTLSHAEIEAALRDSLIPDSNYDAVTAQLLERTHQHYVSALEAENQQDSVRSATEFEYAIAILNELAYYPNIESNSDFNDLSRSVMEDYEKYIAVIDSLSPNTSVFALRKKLDQINEAVQELTEGKILGRAIIEVS